MDDKAGLWVVIEALRRASMKKLNYALYAVSTVQEEIGLRRARTSAYGIDPQVGIAVDVTHATDCPTIDKKQEGDIALGSNTVILSWSEHEPGDRRSIARNGQNRRDSLSIGGQWSSNRHRRQLDTDQSRRRGDRIGEYPQPLHAHAVEMISLTDIDRAANLMAGFALRLVGNEDFTP